MDNKDREGDSESVRGQQELPQLAPWSAASGPVDLSDWLAIIEPIMSDLSATSGLWWTTISQRGQQLVFRALEASATG